MTHNGFPVLLDLSSEITRTNNRMCRQMSNFKVQAIKIQVDPDEGGAAPLGDDGTYVTVKGRLRYLKPTKGRISALKKGRMAWFAARRNDGLTWNKHQDFRVTPQATSVYCNAFDGVDNQTYPSIPNLSTLDGNRALACFSNAGSGYELFTNHNDGLEQLSPSTTNMSDEGLTTRLDTAAGDTDFMLEEEVLLATSANHADDDYEYIPFTCSYNDSGQITNWEWDASPNLYLSVLCGWFEILLDEVKTDADSTLGMPIIDMEIQFQVTGWTSFSKRRSRRKKYWNASTKSRYKKAGKMAWKGYKAWKKYRR